jgi:hypothetical protein
VVHNRAAFGKVLTGGTIASGEAYIDGDWSSPDLTEVTRLFSANMDSMDSMQASQHWYTRLALRIAHAMNRNTHEGSRRNISAHYDLGNDFFRLFLDPTMMYSSALFESPEVSLEQAAVDKLDEICRQLELSADDHLLEIGTGWGGMAIHAAHALRLPRHHHDHLARAVRSRAGAGRRTRARRAHHRALRGLPRAVGAIRQAGIDRDDRGRRPRLLQQLLPVLQQAPEAQR